MDTLVQWIGPLFAAVLALIGMALTFLQFRLKSQEHKFRLYRKRMEAYYALDKLWNGLQATGKITGDAIELFIKELTPFTLLFSSRTRNLVIEVYEEALNNQALFSEIEQRKSFTGVEGGSQECLQSSDALNKQLIPHLIEQMAREITPAEDLIPKPQFKDWWRRSSERLKRTPLYQRLKGIKWLTWYPGRSG